MSCKTCKRRLRLESNLQCIHAEIADILTDPDAYTVRLRQLHAETAAMVSQITPILPTA